MWHYSFSCILPLECGFRFSQLVSEVLSVSEMILGYWGDVILGYQLQIKPQGRGRPHNSGGHGGFFALGEPNCHFCYPRPHFCRPKVFLASFEKRGAKLKRLGDKVYIRSILFPGSPTFVLSTYHSKSDLPPWVTSTLHLQPYIHWVANIHTFMDQVIHDACASLHVSLMSYSSATRRDTNAQCPYIITRSMMHWLDPSQHRLDLESTSIRPQSIIDIVLVHHCLADSPVSIDDSTLVMYLMIKIHQ